MNTEQNEKEAADLSIKEMIGLLKGSGRIEQIYLVIDRTVKLAKKIYPDSYCISCPLTCCINDLFLPVSFLEWKPIKTYLDKKTEETTKKQIRENLEKIPEDLFKDIDSGETDLTICDINSWKNNSCPLLINNKCSIKPYRPMSCRTYGLFLKNESSSEINACNPESERWKDQISNLNNDKIYLSPVTVIKETLEHHNRKTPYKLLIVWLKEYFL